MTADKREGLELERALDQWAAQTGSESARQVVTALGSAYRAAARFQEAVERLLVAGRDTRSQGRALYELRTWLYEELPGHAAALKEPLDRMIAEVYGRDGDQTQ